MGRLPVRQLDLPGRTQARTGVLPVAGGAVRARALKARGEAADRRCVTLHADVGLGGTVGEDAEDLRTFLHQLQGCPPIQHTQLLRCAAHDDSAGRWFYVQADATQAVARWRCLACGRSTDLLDSGEQWTHPPMHACSACAHSIMELAAGLHTEEVEDQPSVVQWLALAARCVECGRIDGLTDAYVPGLTVGELAAILSPGSAD